MNDALLDAAAVERRTLRWDGCLNVRDLGGLPRQGGGRTAFGVVVRADSVRTLSDAGWRAVLAHDVSRIVDLRFHDELAADPPRGLPVEVVHVPVLPEPTAPEWAELDAIGDAQADAAGATREVYTAFLERFPSGWAQAVAAVAEAPAGPSSCTATRARIGPVSWPRCCSAWPTCRSTPWRPTTR